MHESPWTTLASRLVYENPWMRVREDQVLRPDGQPGIYGVIEARIATGVVALDEELRLPLVGQFRYTTNTYSWELPEGGAEEGETALAAAQRELREETGLVAEDWTPLGGPLHLSNCFSSEVGHLFLARGLRQVGAAPDGTERLEVVHVPFAEALRRVDAGEITDAVSVIGILRAARVLGL